MDTPILIDPKSLNPMAKPTHKRPKSEHVERDANEELVEKR